MENVLLIYLIGIPVVFIILCFACIFDEMDNNRELYTIKQVIGISLFWPIWILFNLPKWVWMFVKFLSEVIVQFVKDLFKID